MIVSTWELDMSLSSQTTLPVTPEKLPRTVLTPRCLIWNSTPE